MKPFKYLMQNHGMKGFMKLFSSAMVAQLTSLLLAPALSRLFTPDDFGLVALYLGIFSILSVLSTAKYEQAIMLPRKHADGVWLFRLVLIISLIFSSLILVLVTLFNQSITRLSGNPDLGPWLYFLPLSLLLHGLFQASSFYANRLKRFGLMARTTLIQYGLLNVSRIGAGWVQAPFNGLVFGQLVAQGGAALSTLSGIRKSIGTAAKGMDLKRIRELAGRYSGYPRYHMLHQVANNLSGSLPVFVLTWGFSPAAAGLYAFGHTFVFKPLSMFSQSATQVFSQQMIETHHLGVSISKPVRNMALRLLLLALPAFILLMIWAPAAFSFLFSPAYAEAGYYIRLLSPWLLLVFVAGPLSFLPELYFRQKKALVIDLVYLLLRLLALLLGVWTENIRLALGLFSAAGVLVVGYNLYWYLSLARQNLRTQTHD